MAINFLVDGKAATTEAPAGDSAAVGDREDLKLTGTKFGCGAGLCGAGSVHIDGKRAFSCQTQVSKVVGRSVTTIEGLSPIFEAIRCKRPGSPNTCPNAATASPARL